MLLALVIYIYIYTFQIYIYILKGIGFGYSNYSLATIWYQDPNAVSKQIKGKKKEVTVLWKKKNWIQTEKEKGEKITKNEQ